MTNSCTCTDYDTNGLGTCKHIEKVKLQLVKKGKLKFKNAQMTGSERVEVYVQPDSNIIRIILPKGVIANKLLQGFFSADGSLIADIPTALPVITRIVNEAPDDIRKSIRLSNRLDVALKRAQDLSRKNTAREHFLKDVRDGKRSMDIMKLQLYDYQRQGMLHLAFNERAILADEMGLGKTVQAIAACELLRRTKGIRKVLVIATTSLKSEWEEQIAKFSSLPSLTIYGKRPDRLHQYQQDSFFYLANYEQIMRDHKEIQRILAPDLIILDEAQRIKNWRTKTAIATKSLNSPYAFVLTGTPIENRIDDIYSIVQFLEPRFFGSLFRFNRAFYQFDDKGKPCGYKNLDILNKQLKPILLRRRKADVESELPERTINNYYVQMTEEQNIRYGEFEFEVLKLVRIAERRPLTEDEFRILQLSLASMRMLCDTPYILDENCRLSPKLDELVSVLEELLQDETAKIIIFSEWERMLFLVRETLTKMEIGFSWHTGSVEQKKRRAEIQRFKDDLSCRVFLSTDSGSVGLNLQVANVVINMDLPWNPAKLEQRIARAWRKHQTRSVKVINFISEDTIEHRMLGLLQFKQNLADNILESGAEAEMDIPSGRAAMVQRLNEILGKKTSPIPANTDTPVAEEKPEDNLNKFRDEIVARFSQRLQKFEAYPDEASNKHAIVAVVEGNIEEPKKQMQQTLGETDSQHSIQLEVIDKATYDTIQRLCQMGILSFNNEKAIQLHQTQANGDAEREAKQQNLRKAQSLLEQAQRKLRMATLLFDGGFYEESHDPLTSAFETVLQSFATFNDCNTGKQVTMALLDKDLTQKFGLPKQAITIAAQLRSDDIVSDQQAVQELHVQVQDVFRYIEENINKTFLECAA